MTDKDTFVTKVGTDENGNLFLLFPHDFNDKLKLLNNEVLLWDTSKIEEGTITVTKTNYIHNDDNI